MKICAIICEFNPFHYGHEYIINQAKLLSGCDMLICIMSENFTQHGEVCVLDPRTRAKHAVLGGADGVIGLPVTFSSSPAELFAKGAVKILDSIPEVTSLAFGCEDPDVDFMKTAKFLSRENETFKKLLKNGLASGESYIKSYSAAFETCGGQKDFLNKANNILAIEYAKAIISSRSDIELLPIKRKGADYSDLSIDTDYPSAKAIRLHMHDENVKNCVPEYVYNDLKSALTSTEKYEQLAQFKLLESTTESLKKISGCNEGLENKLKALSGKSFNEILSNTTGKRYTESRIRRILNSNLLGIYEDDCKEFLKSDLYIYPIAIKNSSADKLLSALTKSRFPVLMRKRNIPELSDTSKKCFDLDIKAYKIRNFISKTEFNGFEYPIFI